MADADRERIARLAEAVADRAAVDWDHESARTGEPLRSRVRNLRVVQQIDRAHSESSDGSVERETEELPAAPTSWGSLEIIALIDSGGFGQVYRARDEALDAEVALKLLRRVPAGEDPLDERFLGEARKLARVRHPNVLTVHGVAVHDGVVGLWTELLHGVTLERRLEAEGPLGANEAALVGIDLCRALAAVHQAGIVHRDVKTKNVMREKGGRIVLLDFSAGSDRRSSSSSPAGTPLYMAPELLEGRDSGTAADLYALGVLLYRLVTGRYPVEGRDLSELRRAHSERKRNALLDVRADLPGAFVRVVERALEPDPRRRYATAGEMEQDLAAFVGSAPARPTPPGTVVLPKRIALAIAAVVVLGVLAGLWMFRGAARPLQVGADWLRVRDGRSEVLRAGSTLASGDCLRLSLTPSRPSHVYVLNEDAAGATAVLFPLSSLDVANPVSGGARHVLPGTVAGRDKCWPIGGGGGEETLFVIVSLDPLREFEAEIARLPRVDGSAAASIPGGGWGRRLRGVVGLSSVDVAGPKLSDLARALSGEIARKAGLWTWEARFPTDGPGAAARPRELPETERERQERLLLDAPDDPVGLVALGRTLLRAGDDPESLHDHARALELATRALELDPGSIDACETRAVALERVFLREPAVHAWERCLEIGGDAAFDERARTRLRQLGEPRPQSGWKTAEPRLRAALASGRFDEIVQIAHDHPEQTMSLVESELLAAWAESRAERALAGLESIARGVLDATGDRWLDAVVRTLRSGANPRVTALAEAHQACSAAIRARRSGDCASATRSAQRARAGFEATASPYVQRAEYEVAVCDYQDGRLDRAEQSLAKLVTRTRDAGYHALTGDAQWMQGLVASRQGRFAESQARYVEAAATFRTIGFATRLVALDNLIAQNDDLLGDYRAGWLRRHSVLADIDRIDDPRKQHQVWLSAAVAASTQGLPRVAVEFESVGLASARARGDVVEIVNGSARLASFLSQAERRDEAAQVMADARSWLTAHPQASRPELEAVVAGAEGEVLLDRRPVEALADLDRAIEYFENGRQFRLAELYPLRGHIHQKSGDFDAAEKDLERGIARLEETRPGAGDEPAQVALADLARRVYDQMVAFQVEVRKEPETALDYAERGRARLLRNRLGRKDLPPAREWAALTPPSLAWVYYVLLDDRLLIWTCRDAKLQHVERPIDARRA